MYGIDAWTDAKIDEALGGVESMRLKYVGLVYGEFSAEARNAYKKLHLDAESRTERCGGAHLGFLDALMGRSATEWVVGTSEPSIADCHLFDIYDLHVRIFPEECKQLKHLAEHHARFSSLPNVKAYLAGPRRLPRPNGNDNGV